MNTITIGRGDGCQIFIDDEMISRRHAILKVSTFGKMEIVDMSKNGTFVNGIRLRPNVPVPVKRKDVVSFANVSKLDWKQVPNPGKYYQWAAWAVGVLVLLILALIIYRIAAPKPEPKPVKYEYVEESMPTTISQPEQKAPTQQPKGEGDSSLNNEGTDNSKNNEDADTSKSEKEKEVDLDGKSLKDLQFAKPPVVKPNPSTAGKNTNKQQPGQKPKLKQQQTKPQQKQQPKAQPQQNNNKPQNKNIIL